MRAVLELVAADDRFPAYLELEQDVVFRHLSPAERLRYVERALDVGREAARGYQARHLAEVEALASQWGARVIMDDGGNFFGAVQLRAQHDQRAGVITLYRRSLDQMESLLALVLPEPWSWDRVVATHLAHELFHHLEHTRLGPVDGQLPPVTTFRVGRLWETRCRARRCREIAAHAFTRTLLGLPFLPNAIDWVMLVAMGRWTEEALVQALEAARQAVRREERRRSGPDEFERQATS